MSTTYTLTKGSSKVHFLVTEETATMRTSTDRTQGTSTKVMTPTEATNQINGLIRQGYKATKR